MAIAPVPLDRLGALLDPQRAQRLAGAADRARALFAGHTLWNVNATATGGGVAEMLLALLAYSRGAGVDARWLVLDGDPGFFAITKRLHNVLHGSPGDGGPLGPAEAAHYRDTLSANAESLRALVRPGDYVLLHDPQTAGLVGAAHEACARVVWRCHIGRDEQDDLTRTGWEFLRPHLGDVDALVFSRRQYAPDWVCPKSAWR